MDDAACAARPRQVAGRERYGGVAVLLAERDRLAAGVGADPRDRAVAQVGKREVVLAVAAVGVADNREQGLVLVDLKERSVGERPALRDRAAREGDDLAQHGLVGRDGGAGAREYALGRDDVVQRQRGLVIVDRRGGESVGIGDRRLVLPDDRPERILRRGPDDRLAGEVGQVEGVDAVAAVSRPEHGEQARKLGGGQLLAVGEHVAGGREVAGERRQRAQYVVAAGPGSVAADVDQVVDLQARLVVVERLPSTADIRGHVLPRQRDLIGAGFPADVVALRADSELAAGVRQGEVRRAVAAVAGPENREQRLVRRNRDRLPRGDRRVARGETAREGPDRPHRDAGGVGNGGVAARKDPLGDQKLVQAECRLIVGDRRRRRPFHVGPVGGRAVVDDPGEAAGGGRAGGGRIAVGGAEAVADEPQGRLVVGNAVGARQRQRVAGE